MPDLLLGICYGACGVLFAEVAAVVFLVVWRDGADWDRMH